MSNHTDAELRAKLRLKLSSEIGKAQQFQPKQEQDAIFQEMLDSTLRQKKPPSRVRHPWVAAAVIVLAVGLVTVLGQGLFSNSSVSSGPISKGLASNEKPLSVMELINASNQIESELAGFNKNNLNSLQYIEVLKIRDDIVELDDALNDLYRVQARNSEEQIQQLWQQRLQMARQLKAIYTNEYMVARI